MSIHSAKSRSSARQRGAILVVALLLLVPLTIIGIGSMRTTIIQERMAGNLTDQELAFQAAEAALREGETCLAPLQELPGLLDFTAETREEPAPGSCAVYGIPASATQAPTAAVLSGVAEQIGTWTSRADPYAGGNGMSEVHSSPRVLREHLSYMRDHLVTGFGERLETGRDIYRITARGTGRSDQSEVLLQTTYAKRFN